MRAASMSHPSEGGDGDRVPAKPAGDCSCKRPVVGVARAHCRRQRSPAGGSATTAASRRRDPAMWVGGNHSVDRLARGRDAMHPAQGP